MDSSSPIYAENLRALPAGTRRALDDDSEVAVYMNRGLEAAAVCLPDGRTLPLHGTTDQVAAAGALLDRVGDAPLLAVVGPGLGYLLDAIERRGAATRVLALEPIPALARAMLSRRDWRPWLTGGRLALLVGPDYPDATAAFRLFGRDVMVPPLLASPLVEREFPSAAVAAQAVVARIVAGARANAAARRKFAGRYLLNTLRNIPAIAAEGDAAALTGTCAGIPAVVVGAGPTLDRNLDRLRALQGTVLLVAVDTAVRPLLAAGVRPHVAVSVDPSDVNAQHLRDLPDADGIALVAEGSIDASVLPPFAGRTFIFRVSRHEPWPWLAEQGAERGVLQAWGSVLTTAFDFAIRAGCEPIVFAGADLAYTRGLQYCRNTAFEPRWQHLTTDEARAEQFRSYLADHPHLAHPDVHGAPTITTRDFIQFRDWIVSRAGGVRPRRILNGTGDGILHGAAIEQVPLDAISFPRLEGETIPARLAAAWDAGRNRRDAARGALATALAARDELPLAAWLEFGGDTATADAIHAAAEAAAAGVGVGPVLSSFAKAPADRSDPPSRRG